jgi:hypothetical protein
MKIPIELQNIIYQYKMDMDFLLLEEERKKNKEVKDFHCNLINKFSQIYLGMQKFKLGDKIINSKTKRIGSVIDLLSVYQKIYPLIVIKYDDQEDVHWCIPDKDIFDFTHYKPHKIYHTSDNCKYYTYYVFITVLIAMMYLFVRNIIDFSTFHSFLLNFISLIFIFFILITIYTIRQMNALRAYRNYQFN